ncbi:MAG: hypothetical protein JSW00_16755 [Thermoplasmata archaeon]|nr:MAG: hypothetical protein JSW00_16755 [Thermoplasmata archaeon]
MSKKERRIELEDKLQTKSKICPYCKSEMKFGYISAVYPIFWADTIKLFPKNTERLSGILAPVNHLPTLKCNNCRIIIGQYG